MNRILFILAAVLILSACSSHNIRSNSSEVSSSDIITKSEQSFAFPSIIWNKHIYRVTNEKITNVYKEIGEIQKSSGNETEKTQDNSSNYFPKGTKIFSIVGIDSSIAVAVKSGENLFVKAESYRP